MKSFPVKFRLILIPLLQITVGWVLFYSLLNMGLTFRPAGFYLKEEVTDFWVALTAPIIPLTIWFRPRIKLLKFPAKNSGNDPAFLYLLVATLVIGLPTSQLQGYLRTATGKLTSLASISQIRESKPTRYYRVQSYFIDTSSAAFYTTTQISGKHNEYRNWTISVACPLYDKQEPIAPLQGEGSQEDTKITPRQDSAGRAWLCFNYKEQISNRLDTAERHERWKMFFDESLEDLRLKDKEAFEYLDRIGNTDERDHYRSAIRENSGSAALPDPLFILEPRYTPFEARNGHRLVWVFGSLGIGLAVWLIMLAIPKLDESAVVSEDHPGGKSLSLIKNKTNGQDLHEILKLLLPRPGYWAVPVIMDINILVFLLLVLAGKGFIDISASDLLTWGANYGPRTSDAREWWRLLTSTFLHAGIMHLLFNMGALLFAGIYLEPALGRLRLTVVYLITGIAASLVSLRWHPAIVSVGASGAIFGLFGVFLALLTTQFFPPGFKKQFMVVLLVYVGINLVMGMSEGIDNAAHVGGLVSGMIAGYILYPRLKKEKEDRGGSVWKVN